MIFIYVLFIFLVNINSYLNHWSIAIPSWKVIKYTNQTVYKKKMSWKICMDTSAVLCTFGNVKRMSKSRLTIRGYGYNDQDPIENVGKMYCIFLQSVIMK